MLNAIFKKNIIIIDLSFYTLSCCNFKMVELVVFILFYLVQLILCYIILTLFILF